MNSYSRPDFDTISKFVPWHTCIENWPMSIIMPTRFGHTVHKVKRKVHSADLTQECANPETSDKSPVPAQLQCRRIAAGMGRNQNFCKYHAPETQT